MKWRIFGAEGWKWHVVPEPMEKSLAEDGIKRNHTPYLSEPTDKMTIDLPGMISMNRTYQEFDVDGLQLSIPSTDLKVFDHELRTVKERKFADGTRYFKIHGYMHCMVMTPEQRTALLTSFKEKLPEAERLRKEEDAALSAALSGARAHGVHVMSFREERHKNDLIEGQPISGQMNEEKN